jgi:hypothetical protein
LEKENVSSDSHPSVKHVGMAPLFVVFQIEEEK